MIVTAPGEEGAGRLRRRARWCAHPETGKYRRTRLFVFTLGYSRKSGAAADLAVEHADLGRAARARRFAGSAAPSASSSSTTCARACSRRTSTTRRSTRSTATCSRTTASSRCRVASAIPIARARSKSAIGHTQKTPLKGLRFETLEEAQAYLDRWDDALGRHAHPRHHQAPGRRDVRRGAARTCGRCPLEPFRYYQLRRRAPCISTAASRSTRAYYAPPPGWIGRASPVQWDERARPPARSHDGRSCCASTCAQPRGRHRDRAPRIGRRARRPTTLDAARARARAPAPHDRRALRDDPSPATAQLGVRRILGVLALAKKHGAAAVDDACAAALELGVADLPLRPPLPRAAARRAPLTLAPGRSAHPRAHPLPRRHRAARPRRTPDMNLVELERALRQLRLLRHGRRPRDAAARRPRPSSWPPSTSSPRSSATSSCAARTGSSSAASSRPASATPARRSTPSTSTSTRR